MIPVSLLRGDENFRLTLRDTELAREFAAVLFRLRGSICMRNIPIPLMAGEVMGFRAGLQCVLTTSSIMRGLRPRLAGLFPPSGGERQ